MIRAFLVGAAVVTLTACGSHASSIRLTPDGHIGPLRMGVSTTAAVVAFLGEPDAERHDHNITLGYDCRAGDGWRLTTRGPTCNTVYWIVASTGRLGDFYTRDPRYELQGVRVGTGSATAERLLHKRLYDGCEADLFAGRAAVEFVDGHDVHQANGSLHVVGAHVHALAVNGNAGIFDCL